MTVDVLQFIYERKTIKCKRSQVSLWTYNLTSVDVRKFLYGRKTCGHGRPPVTIWTYNITYGRPFVSLWTYYMTSVDVHEFLYGRTTCGRGHPPVTTHCIRGRPPAPKWTYNVRPWTSTSYYKDVQHNFDGRSSSSIRMCNDWP